jgi:hypothetical protein
MTSVRVDHVIYAVCDLDAAAARFWEEFGLASVAGGRHPGWGTANRIVPLGEEYVELIGVVDEPEAKASGFGARVLEAASGGERLIGWAVASDDLQGIAERLELEVADGERERPDGSKLRWQLAGMERSLTGFYPLFVQWSGPAERHPGRAPVQHRVRPRAITRIELTGEEDALREYLGESELPLRIIAGSPGISAAAVGTDAGEIELR